MRRLDALLLTLCCGGAGAAEPAFRYSAPIAVQQPAAFVQLPLPASAYARSLKPGLADLRIVDARGERVPFALLPWRGSVSQNVEQQHAAALYPLPRRPAAGTAWPSPLEVVVQGERISVRRRGGAPAPTTAAPGWLFDLGEVQRGEPPPSALQLAWSGPAEFSAPYDLETSDELRVWRRAGGGQVMALQAGTGPLTQARVPLPADSGRFVRLVWVDPATAPLLTGVQAIAARQRSVMQDAPAEWQVAPGADAADAPKGSLHFDLGGVLPVVQFDLQGGAGTRVTPLRVLGRNRSDEAWRPLAQGVVYQIERGGIPSRSPPLALQASTRYVRVVPDERAAALDAATTRLVVQAQLASLVFAAQGQPPFTLLAGATDANPGALPVATLVPALDEERARFGGATLGNWQEVAAVARQAETEQRNAALRPWLLWALLLGGVAVLGWMAWRLARAQAAGRG